MVDYKKNSVESDKVEAFGKDEVSVDLSLGIKIRDILFYLLRESDARAS